MHRVKQPDAVSTHGIKHLGMHLCAADVLLGVRSEPKSCEKCGGDQWELVAATAQSARLIAITAAGGMQCHVGHNTRSCPGTSTYMCLHAGKADMLSAASVAELPHISK